MIHIARQRGYLDNKEIDSKASPGYYSSPVLQLLACARSFEKSQCSDVRDRIHALLGFPYSANVVKADYSIPPARVWMNFGLAFLREGYVDLLLTTAAQQFYRGYERVAGLPSWIPDFSAPIDSLPRDLPGGTAPFIDEHNYLHTTLRWCGEVGYHNGRAVCTGMPEDVIEEVSALLVGP